MHIKVKSAPLRGDLSQFQMKVFDVYVHSIKEGRVGLNLILSMRGKLAVFCLYYGFIIVAGLQRHDDIPCFAPLTQGEWTARRQTPSVCSKCQHFS